MSLSRFQALDTILNRSGFELEYVNIPDGKISSFFGCNVFNDAAMREYMTEEAFNNVKLAIESGAKLSREDADIVADAMKRWSMDHGATHYTHWFQPLTGRTAEKHDSFFTLKPDGTVVEEFDGDTLVQQEPDGSSFPGGGLRSTFEARGYTAWDPSSPAFILEVSEGKTLCIPTIFVTYGGDSLDYKLPLLKSQAYLEKAAIPVCQLFDDKVSKVITTLGWEQEYFLVDEALYNARPDLLLTGRTLLGKHSPKGQQLDDHYFGSIPERVYAYMRDLETECHKLGIPVRTRHNEVGPGQYELAPMYEECNLAVDHNQLLMDLMDRVARRHKLRVLLHEKPFAGVNGSGKHNNWSMSTNTGRNLLSPGKQPGKNLLFLTFFMNTVQAVYRYADVLRASVSSASNDHRLGANEAPPAIVSVFIGETLTDVLSKLEAGIDADAAGVKEALDLLSKIPNLELDNTDRNRTSPFAFTGNKFEIRMVGSSMNCAAPMTVMNTIVGRQLVEFKAELDGMMKEGTGRDEAILAILKRYIKESKPICFEGDGYSDEWKEEAERRGLSNIPNTPDALGAYLAKDAVELFTSSGVFTEREMHAHYDVMCENYILKLQIESRTLGEMVVNHILPAAISYQNQLAENILQLKELGLPESAYEAQFDILKLISENISNIKLSVNQMTDARKKANGREDATAMARTYCYDVKPLMEDIRTYADRLEYLVDDREWPMIKYRELMFVR
ncbi:MAG: glutamine synthetase III [Lewinellaceae bacterium]|nr:glutamine synthetase III [Phaeodactylibacter sp.]MCB0614463.1 glutamine synthetase III [Phaeodactylibacter sp.]MCB9351868.1 glutamine synthetase III [Lewinellaceae bacterium]